MKLSEPTSKQKEVISWVQCFRNSSSMVMVSNFCYDCCLTGEPKTKTLIVFPEEIDSKGIIAIDKPLEEVEMLDVIKLYKKIKCN